MLLVTGGAYQGKTDYAVTQLGIPREAVLSGADCPPEAVFRAKCIRGYHLLIRRLLEAGEAPLGFTERLIAENPGIVILLDEIGCGIIPLAAEERRWREHTGWCGCLLAERAEAVIRLCCGIPAVIKGELP